MIPVSDEVDVIPRSAVLLFIPIDKRAFGAAIGAAGAALTATVTIAVIISGDPRLMHGLGLLSHYFSGYTASWVGAVIGAFWAFVVGFVVGWLTAFTRNLSLAVSLFLLRSRAELGETSDFLDHI
jgi:F0F1-type ATP synthase membrane subunit a